MKVSRQRLRGTPAHFFSVDLVFFLFFFLGGGWGVGWGGMSAGILGGGGDE